jgi:hypothetical protein
LRAALLIGLGLQSCVPAASAQQSPARIEPTFSAFVTAPTRTWQQAPAPDTTAREIPATQWKQGLLIGGLIGSIGLGGFVYAFCEGFSEEGSCIGPALGGAAVGGIAGGTLGALIGGQIPQRTDTVPAPDSTAVAE